MTEPYRHRIRLTAGAEVVVRVSEPVEAGDIVANARQPGPAIRLPIAKPMRRRAREAAELVVVEPGSIVRANQPLARTAQRDVRCPQDAIFVGYSLSDGMADLIPLQMAAPTTTPVRGVVQELDSRSVTVAVPAVAVTGVDGTGPVVHGPLTLAVGDPAAILEPTAISAGSAGRVLVGGAWASAEAITRARAVGVAAIVVGGLHARELADFRALQHRRSLLGTAAPPFAVIVLDGYGRAGMDPARFAWLQAHADHPATVLGDERRLLVYDAAPAPSRAARPILGDRVLIVAGPGRGQAGLLADLPSQPMAAGSGISTRTGLVRLDTGRTVPVPLANLEATIGAA